MKEIPMLVIRNGTTVRYPTLTKAAQATGVSRYTVVTCYFTDTCLPDGTWFDLALDVTGKQERQLHRSWMNARATSRDRRRDGIFEKEL